MCAEVMGDIVHRIGGGSLAHVPIEPGGDVELLSIVGERSTLDPRVPPKANGVSSGQPLDEFPHEALRGRRLEEIS